MGNEPVSSKRDKLACVPIEDSVQTAHPIQSAQSLHWALELWLAKGLIFFKAEN